MKGIVDVMKVEKVLKLLERAEANSNIASCCSRFAAGCALSFKVTVTPSFWPFLYLPLEGD